ncbi:MAG: BON domain-containing protein [Methylophilaceae bacterium]|nr:BON domain-containing protein [Methylophilaceae bacterium]
MKSKFAISLALVGSLLVPVAGYAGDYTGDRSAAAKEFVKDSVITAKIKAKLAKEKDVSAMHIKVDTDQAGVVYLSGTAKSQAEADRAVALAQEVEGVTSVENKIEVK